MSNDNTSTCNCPDCRQDVDSSEERAFGVLDGSFSFVEIPASSFLRIGRSLVGIVSDDDTSSTCSSDEEEEESEAEKDPIADAVARSGQLEGINADVINPLPPSLSMDDLSLDSNLLDADDVDEIAAAATLFNTTETEIDDLHLNFEDDPFLLDLGGSEYCDCGVPLYPLPKCSSNPPPPLLHH